MEVLSFCIFSLLCSRLHPAAAWITRPSLQHARHLSHLRSLDSTTSGTSITSSTRTNGSSTRPLPSRHAAAPRESSAVSASGWRAPPPHAYHTNRSGRNSATAVALSVTSPSSSTSTDTDTEEEGGAVGYKVNEGGRCSGVEALPPLKNRYYALRHGQSVANM